MTPTRRKALTTVLVSPPAGLPATGTEPVVNHPSEGSVCARRRPLPGRRDPARRFDAVRPPGRAVLAAAVRRRTAGASAAHRRRTPYTAPRQ